MKFTRANVIVSLALILVGGFFMAMNLGYVRFTQPSAWAAMFGGLGLLFFVAYLASGLRQWGLLFPAAIGGSLSAMMGLTLAGFNSPVLGSFVLAGVALPFFVAFILDRQRNWWALIPAIILTGITCIPLVESRMSGELIASMVIFSVAMPFLLIFLANPTRRWALIPALVLGFIGMIPVITLVASEPIAPALIMLDFAAPFFVVFAAERRAWWALIPGGFFVSIGAGVLVSVATSVDVLVPATMFAGWGLTFAVLWLLRSAYPTRWAIFPALSCLGLGVLLALLSPVLSFVWPIALIGGGGYVIYRTIKNKA